MSKEWNFLKPFLESVSNPLKILDPKMSKSLTENTEKKKCENFLISSTDKEGVNIFLLSLQKLVIFKDSSIKENRLRAKMNIFIIL